MKLIKYQTDMNPLDPFRFFHDEESHYSIADRWFKHFLDNELCYPHKKQGFPIDLYEDNTHYYAKAALPGFKKEDITIDLENQVLTIKAHMHKEKKDKTSESSCESYVTRSITIPEGIAPDKIAAKHEHGMLTIAIPKVPAKKPHKIAIN